MQGVCGSARCWNVEGSFTCECENGQEEFDPLAGQCVSRESAGNTHTHTHLQQKHSNSVSVLSSTGSTTTTAITNDDENNNSFNEFTLHCCNKCALYNINKQYINKHNASVPKTSRLLDFPPPTNVAAYPVTDKLIGSNSVSYK